MNKITEEDRLDSKQRMDYFLKLLTVCMESSKMSLGWDKEQNKLMIIDVKRKISGKIKLEKLNDNVFKK